MDKNPVLMSLMLFLLFAFLIIICVLSLYMYSKKSKRKDAFYSVRISFNKNHPIISKLMIIIPVALLSILSLWHVSTYMRDLIGSEVLSCEGKVVHISSGYLSNDYVYLDDGSTVINFRNHFNIESGKTYKFNYAPNTKIILKIELVSPPVFGLE